MSVFEIEFSYFVSTASGIGNIARDSNAAQLQLELSLLTPFHPIG